MSRNIYHNKFIIFVYYDVIHYSSLFFKAAEKKWFYTTRLYSSLSVCVLWGIVTRDLTQFIFATFGTSNLDAMFVPHNTLVVRNEKN